MCFIIRKINLLWHAIVFIYLVKILFSVCFEYEYLLALRIERNVLRLLVSAQLRAGNRHF